MGIPSDVVALNILIRIFGLKLKGLIVNGKVIFAVFIAVLIGVGFYFGYLRHEPRCYEAIDKKITSTQASLEEWYSTPPDGMTKQDVNELQIVVAKAAANATLKWISQYENICDYYFEGFTLRRK